MQLEFAVYKAARGAGARIQSAWSCYFARLTEAEKAIVSGVVASLLALRTTR